VPRARRAIQVAAALSLAVWPAEGGAQQARPVRFWAFTQYLGTVSPRYYARTDAVVAVPTPLEGWTCTLDPVHQSTLPKIIFQSTDLVCTCPYGSVRDSAPCNLTSEDEHSVSTFVITDSQKRWVTLVVGCQN
jgi:hypothetical protein